MGQAGHNHVFRMDESDTTGSVSCSGGEPQNETVFYLQTDNSLIQLIFTCQVLAPNGVYYPEYCTSTSQLNFTEGERIQVRGTLIEPSMWRPGLSTPKLVFEADLYVFQSKILS
jgi:hypothetical protein